MDNFELALSRAAKRRLPREWLQFRTESGDLWELEVISLRYDHEEIHFHGIAHCGPEEFINKPCTAVIKRAVRH